MIPRALLALLAILVIVTRLDAAILTVGADGAHQSVQAAVDAAVAAGGDQEIWVQAGTTR